MKCLEIKVNSKLKAPPFTHTHTYIIGIDFCIDQRQEVLNLFSIIVSHIIGQCSVTHQNWKKSYRCHPSYYTSIL